MTGNSMFEYVHAEDQQELGAVLNPNLAHRNMFDALSVLSPQVCGLLPPAAAPSQAATSAPGLMAPNVFDAVAADIGAAPIPFGMNMSARPQMDPSNLLQRGAVPPQFDVEAAAGESGCAVECPDGEDGAEAGWPNVRYVSAHIPRAFVMRLKCVLAKRNAGITTQGYKVTI